MRANCDLGISGAICCWELTGASTSSRRIGAVGGEVASTRGLRADWSARGESEANCSVICGFGVNRASAA
jgi:hypothetical protein